MRADVRQLLAGIGVPELRYWDPGDLLPDDEGERPAAAGAAPAGIAIAFASPFAGAGGTSLAATLVTLLAHSGTRCAAIDLDAAAPLVRRLGGDADRGAATLDGAGILSEGRFGVRCLAVGRPDRLCGPGGSPGSRERLEAALGDPEWTVLDGIADPGRLRAALPACDEVVVVLRPGDAGDAGVAAVERWLSDGGCGRAGWLVNRYDGRDPRHRAARASLAARAPGRLLPFVVDEEPAFGEVDAPATLVDVAPESPVLRVLGDLAVRTRGQVTAAPGGGR